MKLATETEATLQQCQIHLPFGLIGLADLQRFDLTPIEGSWPFMSMLSNGSDEISFVVLEPQGLVPGYEIELNEEDADSLQIKSAEDALVLNIVTIHSTQPLYVTANLAGPLIINRNLLIGKQVILGSRHSTHHAIIDERKAANAA